MRLHLGLKLLRKNDVLLCVVSELMSQFYLKTIDNLPGCLHSLFCLILLGECFLLSLANQSVSFSCFLSNLIKTSLVSLKSSFKLSLLSYRDKNNFTGCFAMAMDIAVLRTEQMRTFLEPCRCYRSINFIWVILSWSIPWNWGRWSRPRLWPSLLPSVMVSQCCEDGIMLPAPVISNLFSPQCHVLSWLLNRPFILIEGAPMKFLFFFDNLL